MHQIKLLRNRRHLHNSRFWVYENENKSKSVRWRYQLLGGGEMMLALALEAVILLRRRFSSSH
jgi:hypothetical protein